MGRPGGSGVPQSRSPLRAPLGAPAGRPRAAPPVAREQHQLAREVVAQLLHVALGLGGRRDRRSWSGVARFGLVRSALLRRAIGILLSIFGKRFRFRAAGPAIIPSPPSLKCPRGPGSRPPKSRGGEAPAGAGAERRTPWPALRSGRSLHREGPPAHDADRRAFRRFTAAILGFGTVLPGPDGEHFARPDPGGFGLRSSGPRPARQGAVPRSWDGRWTRSLPGIACEAHPRAPLPAPPSERLRKAPSVSGDRGI